MSAPSKWKVLLTPEKLRAAAKRLSELAETQMDPERKTKLHIDAKNLEVVAKLKEAKLAKDNQSSEGSERERPAKAHSARSEVDDGNGRNGPRDQLRRIFEEASGPMREPIREQLAHRHMIALADNFEGWALSSEMTPEQSAKLLGWAESLRKLSDEVGPAWDPPAPDRLTLLGFLGRKMADE